MGWLTGGSQQPNKQSSSNFEIQGRLRFTYNANCYLLSRTTRSSSTTSNSTPFDACDSLSTRVANATEQDGISRRKFGMIKHLRFESQSINRWLLQFMRKSQMAPPSRIPSPGKGLSEISESQGNARSKQISRLPAMPNLKHKLNGPCRWRIQNVSSLNTDENSE
jgi:hypothetical protein